MRKRHFLSNAGNPSRDLYLCRSTSSPSSRSPLSAESEHDASARSTAELNAPTGSQALGCCKHESSRRAAGVAPPPSGQIQQGDPTREGDSRRGALRRGPRRSLASAITNDRLRRASWRRQSDSRFGLADTESGSAATRPASATLQKQARVRRCPGDGVVNAYALAWHLQPADHFSGSSGGEEASAAVSGDIGMYGSHTSATRGWRREQTSALPQT